MAEKLISCLLISRRAVSAVLRPEIYIGGHAHRHEHAGSGHSSQYLQQWSFMYSPLMQVGILVEVISVIASVEKAVCCG